MDYGEETVHSGDGQPTDRCAGVASTVTAHTTPSEASQATAETFCEYKKPVKKK
jgi:hypothetical protein